MMKTLTLGSCLFVLAAGSVCGQGLSATISPNPAPQGSPITITYEASTMVYLSNGCGLTSVHQGSPAGPAVYTPFICTLQIILLGPGLPASVQWQGLDNSGNPVAPGTYYVRVVAYVNGTGAQLPPSYFPVRIDPPPPTPVGPILNMVGAPTRGQTLQLTINDPAEPFGTYFLAASLTTNQGLTISPTQHLALDQDILWNLSYPNPHPALFLNTLGTLDFYGYTAAPNVFIPNLANLQGWPIAFHAVVIGSTGLKLTNPDTGSIQ